MSRPYLEDYHRLKRGGLGECLFWGIFSGVRCPQLPGILKDRKGARILHIAAIIRSIQIARLMLWGAVFASTGNSCLAKFYRPLCFFLQILCFCSSSLIKIANTLSVSSPTTESRASGHRCSCFPRSPSSATPSSSSCGNSLSYSCTGESAEMKSCNKSCNN